MNLWISTFFLSLILSNGYWTYQAIDRSENLSLHYELYEIGCDLDLINEKIKLIQESLAELSSIKDRI